MAALLTEPNYGQTFGQQRFLAYCAFRAIGMTFRPFYRAVTHDIPAKLFSFGVGNLPGFAEEHSGMARPWTCQRLRLSALGSGVFGFMARVREIT
jgi:hypothetical protein